MGRIQSIWEDAPGRYDEDGHLIDKWIGVEIDGIRKTQAGLVKDGWWYFTRDISTKEEKASGDPPQLYWYKKRRLPAKPGEIEGQIIEEYIGTELPFIVPPEFHDPEIGID